MFPATVVYDVIHNTEFATWHK